MSSPQDSETKRAAIEKAQEGWRLLSSGDYEGAIRACTEAIELYPGSVGARRTRAEAGFRLRERTKAEADQKLHGVEHPDFPPEEDNSHRNKILIGVLLIVVIIVTLITGAIIGAEENSTAEMIMIIIIVTAATGFLFEVFGWGGEGDSTYGP